MVWAALAVRSQSGRQLKTRWPRRGTLERWPARVAAGTDIHGLPGSRPTDRADRRRVRGNSGPGARPRGAGDGGGFPARPVRSVARHVELEHDGVVHQAVEVRRPWPSGRKIRSHVAEDQVARHHHRAALVALGEQREQHLGLVRALLDVAEVVELDYLEEVELAQRAGQVEIPFRAEQFLDAEAVGRGAQRRCGPPRPARARRRTAHGSCRRPVRSNARTLVAVSRNAPVASVSSCCTTGAGNRPASSVANACRAATAPRGASGRPGVPARFGFRPAPPAAPAAPRGDRPERRGTSSSAAVVRPNCVSSVVTRSARRRIWQPPDSSASYCARSGRGHGMDHGDRRDRRTHHEPARWRNRTGRRSNGREASPRHAARRSWLPGATGARTRRRPARRASDPARHTLPGTSTTENSSDSRKRYRAKAPGCPDQTPDDVAVVDPVVRRAPQRAASCTAPARRRAPPPSTDTDATRPCGRSTATAPVDPSTDPDRAPRRAPRTGNVVYSGIRGRQRPHDTDAPRPTAMPPPYSAPRRRPPARSRADTPTRRRSPSRPATATPARGPLRPEVRLLGHAVLVRLQAGPAGW